MNGQRPEIEFVSDAARAARLIARLGAEDAGAMPLLSGAACVALIDAAETLPCRVGRREIGTGDRIVRQDFEICMDVPAASLLWVLAGGVEALLNAALAQLEPSPLAAPLRLNDLVAQRYLPGSFGITAHRDHLRYVGLVALVVLNGSGRFCVCRDRTGADAHEIPAKPGDLLLMRAPGFQGRRDRPFHFLSDITALRYSIGLRQDDGPPR